MSDNSSSTGSSGSSANSWTLLSPEEVAIENIGHGEDGTESLGDVPSLVEDLSGAAPELKHADVPVETVLSEEGHEVCQETSPELSEGPLPSNPARMSSPTLAPTELPELDLESQAPVIHDIVTSSPSDNEHISAMTFVTNIDLRSPRDVPPTLDSAPESSHSKEPATDPMAEPTSPLTSTDQEGHTVSAKADADVPTETLTAADNPTSLDSSIPEDASSQEFEGCTGAEEEEPPLEEELSSGDDLSHEVDGDSVPVSAESWSPLAEEGVKEGFEGCTGAEEEEHPLEDELSSGDERSHEVDANLDPVSAESWSPLAEAGVKEGFEGCTGAEEAEPIEEELSSGDDLSHEVDADSVPVGAESWSPLAEEGVKEGFEGCTGAKEEEPIEEEHSSDEELPAAQVEPETVIPKDKQEEELSSSLDDGLRRRTGPSFEPFRPKTSDEEDEEEELEFRLAEKKEEKPWFSMNTCVVGALVLLFLGSLFLSGDFDASELSDGEQSQEWLSGDPPGYKKEILDKLTQEIQQIAQLEAQLLSQKEELDSALTAAAISGNEQEKADLEKENAKLREELPELKKELESLTARVTELNQLKADLEAAADAQPPKKPVRDNLEEIQRKLSEHVERWEKKRSHNSKWKGNKGKSNGRDHRKKEKEEKEEWKHGKDGDWKVKQNSHKEAWRKDQDEWERKKQERRMDRDDRRKAKPWHSTGGKESEDPHHHHHHHHHRQPHQHDFWRDQQQKLQHNIRPQLGCSSVEDCATKEGLYPVELPEFEELLEGYLSKLESFSSPDSRDKLTKLTSGFFEGGVFIHDRCRFRSFAEDVADILEDMADVLEHNGKTDNHSLEEEMEEFEREALWKFSATA